jgi:hypothetical protein
MQKALKVGFCLTRSFLLLLFSCGAGDEILVLVHGKQAVHVVSYTPGLKVGL